MAVLSPEQTPRCEAPGVACRATASDFDDGYRRLRALAHALLRHQSPNQTLRTTALVHEAVLRMGVGVGTERFQDEPHFFRAAAQAMRHAIVDHARARSAEKRGGGRRRLPLNGLETDPRARLGDGLESLGLDVLALDEALARLESLDERKARVVELRFFAGLDIQRTAQMLDIAAATVERDWAFARAWLRRELLGD